jgi:FAD/FMN-containing dehydrogenase
LLKTQPYHLKADYIADFRALLDSFGWPPGMFGHVDAGALHMRPALNMKRPSAVVLFLMVWQR